jgi:hypothetical protein
MEGPLKVKVFDPPVEKAGCNSLCAHLFVIIIYRVVAGSKQ